MALPFAKMHGAGNDFVVLRDDGGLFPLDDPALVRRICSPHVGLVCEGLIVLRKANAPEGTDFRMVFFNPDGSRAAMCGNGIRCAALFAADAGMAGARMAVATDAGALAAEVLPPEPGKRGARVRVRTSEPRARRAAVRPAGAAFEYAALDTGVPHAVAFVGGMGALAAVDVRAEGALVRNAPEFAPDGTNVDFAAVTGPHELSIRTYERGVEAETAACGTGSIAAAVAAVESGRCESPVDVRVAFGDTLSVDCPRGADGLCSSVLFTGPARFVCRGQLDPEDFR